MKRLSLVFILLTVVVVWAASAWFLLPDIEKNGSFGDMFGAVNALFSGCAFAALVYTI